MKTKRKKYIALLTLISMLVVTCIPLESFALNDSKPEVLIVVEEMDTGDKPETELTVVVEDTKAKDESESELLTGVESKNTQYSNAFQELMSAKGLTATVLPVAEGDNVGYFAINKVLGGTYDATVSTEPDKWYSGNDLIIIDTYSLKEIISMLWDKSCVMMAWL